MLDTEKIIDVFELKSMSLSKQKITEWVGGRIEFFEDHIHYFISFYADEWVDKNDEGMGWHNVFNKYDISARRVSIVGIQKDYLPKDKIWTVAIVMWGFSNDLSMYTKRESEAQELYDKIYNYIFKQ